MPWNHDQELTVYFQALNVFDFVNRKYSMWGGGFAVRWRRRADA